MSSTRSGRYADVPMWGQNSMNGSNAEPSGAWQPCDVPRADLDRARSVGNRTAQCLFHPPSDVAWRLAGAKVLLATVCPDSPAPPAGLNWSPSPVASRSRGLTILLVEDYLDILEFLTLVLQRRGHEVIAAQSLAAARAAAAVRDFDLLISDIELPDGSGLELMRDLGGGHSVPGLALSGFGSKEDVELSRAAGFVAHLTKPVDLRRLEEMVERFRAAPAGRSLR
jgi:CheY-like chemotaxis protein